jgi:hypothetical protein
MFSSQASRRSIGGLRTAGRKRAARATEVTGDGGFSIGFVGLADPRLHGLLPRSLAVSVRGNQWNRTRSGHQKGLLVVELNGRELQGPARRVPNNVRSGLASRIREAW